jgi:DNA-binding transcriptional LysR family regulator
MRSIGSVLAKLRLRQLALIVETADTGSLHEGASRCNVSQPAATKMLREAELLFGSQIFERTSKGMRTTALGNTVLTYARSVVTDLVRLGKDVEAISSGAIGTVSAGTVSAGGQLVLTRAIADLNKDHPNVSVHVRVDTSDVLVPMLLEGKLDFVIGRAHGSAAAELKFDRLSKNVSLAVVAGPQHALGQIADISQMTLQQSQWILHPVGNLLRLATEQAFRDANLQPPRPSVETISDTFTVSLLQQTAMLGIMAREIADFYEQRKLLKILSTRFNLSLGPYGILTRPGRELLPAASMLIALLRRNALKH